MTHGSLFSGIGGFDLAAEWMGWDNIFHCEWNSFGQKVLKHHFPNSISYNDITKTDFSIHEGRIDILTGGFPCQPYSTAGLRKGKADERHLFPEMLRAIKEIKPRWVIGENVRGLVSWNGGMVFNEVCDDLEREGYEVQPFLIPAASINAPHRRDRIWFVAFNSKSQRSASFREFCQGQNYESIGIRGDDKKNDVANTIGLRLEHIKERGNIYKSPSKTQSERSESTKSIKANGNNGDASNSISKRGQLQASGEYTSKQAFRGDGKKRTTREWEKFPTVSPVCIGDDGLSNRLDSITFSKWRKESIKAAGNAIVPQVAHEIFKTIEKFENSL